MSVRAIYEFDPTEHYRAARAMTPYVRARYLIWFGEALALGMLAWTVIPIWSRYPPGMIFIVAVPWLVLALFWLFYLPVSQWRASRTLLARDKSAIGPQERIIDETGLHTRGNGVVLDLPWHVLARVIETDAFFLFFHNKDSAGYLPKRVLSPEGIVSAREFIRNGMKERARLRD
jgi:hypothetical protein